MSIVQSGVQAISVLIDTWWNVNLEEERWKSTGVTVLIDTWWNVNRSAGGFGIEENGF